MNRLQEAMSAVRTNPKSSKAWSDLGQALLEEKQIEKAKQSFQRALQFDPQNEAAQEGIRMALIADQSVTEAPSSPETPASEKVTPPPKASLGKKESEPEGKSKSPYQFEVEPEAKVRSQRVRKAEAEAEAETKARSKRVRKAEAEAKSEPPAKAVTKPKSGVKRKSSDKPQLAAEEEMVDDSISLSGGLTASLSGGKEEIIFREPPLPPEKPTPMRLWGGIALLFFVILLFACVAFFAIYQFLP